MDNTLVAVELHDNKITRQRTRKVVNHLSNDALEALRSERRLYLEAEGFITRTHSAGFTATLYNQDKTPRHYVNFMVREQEISDEINNMIAQAIPVTVESIPDKLKRKSRAKVSVTTETIQMDVPLENDDAPVFVALRRSR